MARMPLTAPRWGLAEHKRNVFRIVPELGTTMEEVLDPTYLANFWRMVKPGDRIEVLREDFGGLAELFVQRVDHGSVTTRLLFSINFDEAEPSAPTEPGYRVEFAGAVDLYRVIRISDGEVVKSGIATEPAAKRWLTNHLKAVS